MNDAPTRQLEQLALAAQSHAEIEHGLTLGPAAVDRADQALDAQRQRGCGSQLEALAACYGAWLGRWACDELRAVWTGLHEPAAPRLNVAGVICSPIDAARRRLQDRAAPSFTELVCRMRRWSEEAKQRADDVLRTNAAAWDRLAGNAAFAGPVQLPADREAAHDAIDPWLREFGIRGRRLLCLAAGGGRHGPLHALAGADVTVVDISAAQLRHDQQAADAHRLPLRTIQTSLDDLSILDDDAFDVVLQPVSTSYLPDLTTMYAEIARVLRSGGIYVVQHKQPASLQASWRPVDGHYQIQRPQVEGAPLPVVSEAGTSHREPGTVEFLHTLDALLGGLCRAGMVIEEVTEPPRGDAFAPPASEGHRSAHLPPYLKIKARRR